MFGKKDIGIDLGTASIQVYVSGKGVMISEPCVLAIDSVTEEVIKYGKEAYGMIGRTPSNIKIVRPLQGGVVHEYEPTSRMIKQAVTAFRAERANSVIN